MRRESKQFHAAAASERRTGITKSSRWSCDIYSGTVEALLAAGHIKLEQLTPQKGRSPGYTAFRASGEPCPVHLRTWREPGFKAIRQQDDGTYSVEITVARDVQLWRRRAERAAQHEEEQDRINKEVVANGHKYRNWEFRQNFDGCAETWEGTKAQLQAAGLGVGLRFPGEPGGPSEYLYCKCPLGFQFRIHLPGYDLAKGAAGIYTAHSWYVPREERSKQYEHHAPGVKREVWAPGGWNSSDFYYGTADALIRAGLVPAFRYFPGQPGTNKSQASYQKNWERATSGNRRVTIRKAGKVGQFSLEVSVEEQEEQRRRQLQAAAEQEKKKQEQVLAQERRQLRQGAAPEKSVDDFRAARAELADFYINMLWAAVFKSADGALSFNISDDSELSDDLAGAFQTIRDAVQDSEVLRDAKLVASARTRLKLVAARNDKGLQSVLQDATRLRLVRPDRDED
jgi:hypothetical protein